MSAVFLEHCVMREMLRKTQEAHIAKRVRLAHVYLEKQWKSSAVE